MAKSGNKALRAAHKAKNDEFYTRLEDIEAELKHYKAHFKGKTVFCNCDDPFESSFCLYFLKNFVHLGLKRLICTSYNTSPVMGRQMSLFDEDDVLLVAGNGYVMDIKSIPTAEDGIVTDIDIKALLTSKRRGVKRLKENGDFRSAECIELLKQADIVVTNPPFSLFREYVAQLIEHDKKFLIIGNQNAITYKDIFLLLKGNKMWLGYKCGGMSFRIPQRSDKSGVREDANGQKWQSLGNICWYTNLDIPKRHEKLILYKKYTPQEYPKYDNYDAVNVDKTKDIPCDYHGVMGVPITFLDKYNPEQFKILEGSNRYGILNTWGNNDQIRANHSHGTFIKGKATYFRIHIRNKHPQNAGQTK